MNAREVVERLLQAGRDLDVDGFVALMAADGYLEWPFRPPGAPARLQGRDAIRQHLTAVAEGFIRFTGYRNVVIHETTDAEVVIAEYDADATVLATGAPFEQNVIAVFRVRDGLVVSYRDYINPLPLLEAVRKR
jgi:ketosteroid isomerase-like protein